MIYSRAASVRLMEATAPRGGVVAATATAAGGRGSPAIVRQREWKPSHAFFVDPAGICRATVRFRLRESDMGITTVSWKESEPPEEGVCYEVWNAREPVRLLSIDCRKRHAVFSHFVFPFLNPHDGDRPWKLLFAVCREDERRHRAGDEREPSEEEEDGHQPLLVYTIRYLRRERPIAFFPTKERHGMAVECGAFPRGLSHPAILDHPAESEDAPDALVLFRRERLADVDGDDNNNNHKKVKPERGRERET